MEYLEKMKQTLGIGSNNNSPIAIAPNHMPAVATTTVSHTAPTPLPQVMRVKSLRRYRRSNNILHTQRRHKKNNGRKSSSKSSRNFRKGSRMNRSTRRR